MKLFSKTNWAKMLTITLVFAACVLFTLCSTSCSSKPRHHVTPAEISANVAISDTVFKCSVTGYNEGGITIQRPNLYVKGTSEHTLILLDAIAKSYYATCDSVCIYKEALQPIVVN